MLNLTSQELLSVRLNLEPIAKARPRHTRSGRVYTPASTATYERAIALLLAHHRPIEGAVSLDVVFVCKRPKTTRTAGRQLKTTKPDVDNLLKSLLDGLNGCLFHDDAQVVEVRAVKLVASADEEPHIDLKIFQMSPC
jgi:Holliday junction resolvase RusA-like endonuclease